jgi:apolipoprotein N-acyltransferase
MQKKYWLLSLFSGLLLALAWLIHPFFVFLAWLPWLKLEAEIYQTQNKFNFRNIFIYSYLTTFTWNILTTWWLLMIEWQGGVAALLINPALMAFPLILFHFFRYHFRQRWVYFTWPVIWLAYEFMQTQWDLAWTWLTLGNVLAPLPYLIQYYELSGVLGGSAMILFFNLSLWWLGQGKEKWLAYLIICILLIINGLSVWKFQNYEEKGQTVNILVVQPNINPYTEKFSKHKNFIPFDQQFKRITTLTQEKLTLDVDLVLYPESATGVLWDESSFRKNPLIFQEFAQLNQTYKAYPQTRWLLGMNTYSFIPQDQKNLPTSIRMTGTNSYYQKFNAAVFVKDTSAKVAIYHKSKLVPAGEMVPFPQLLKPIFLIFDNLKGLITPQTERTIFQLNKGVKIAPLICYESTFGEFSNQFIQNGAQILCVITNDAFWRGSPEPWQHQQIDRIRAIETRRAIARASHHGFSGFINQKGQILQSTPTDQMLAEKGIIRANTKLTFYVKYGDWLGRGAFFSLFVLIGWIIFKIIRKNQWF